MATTRAVEGRARHRARALISSARVLTSTDMAAEEETASLFFIDSNRAYRGPVTTATLRYLLQTQAISTTTYVFSETLAECNHSWVRLKRLPKLLEELQQPVPAARATANAPPKPSQSGGPADANAAAASSSAAAAASASASAPAPPAAAVPTLSANPTAESAATPCQSATVTHLGLSPGAGAGGAVLPGQSDQQSTRPSNTANAPHRDKLFEYFPAVDTAPAAPSRPSSGGGGLFGFFSSRSKAPPNKSDFGIPLSSCNLDSEHGVPQVLANLRRMLFEQNGHLVEGIFRVSPSSSVLQAARADANAGHLEKVQDPASIAHLVKLWFRTRITLHRTARALRHERAAGPALLSTQPPPIH